MYLIGYWSDQYLFLYAKLLVVLFPPFLSICLLCVRLQHYMSASTAGYMLDYVSNSKQAVALKGFWLCCHVSLAPVTFDSRASTKSTKKLTLNKFPHSRWCIEFVSTGFCCGSVALLQCWQWCSYQSLPVEAWGPGISLFQLSLFGYESFIFGPCAPLGLKACGHGESKVV